MADSFQSGDVIKLERGNVQLEVAARYLGGNTSTAVIDLTVLQPARPSGFQVEPSSFNVSTLGAGQSPDGGE